MAQRDTCLFCPRPPDSKEHIFPDWINQAFPRPKNSPPLKVTRRVGDTVDHFPAGQIATLKVGGAVCQPCNTGWMCTMEGNLKPLIRGMILGDESRLRPIEQLDLSTWATLKAFVFEVARDFPPIATHDDCMILKDQLRPPASVRVFLAAAADGTSFGIARNHVEGYRTAESTDPSSAWTTTLILGHLVVQVLASDSPGYRAFETAGVADDRKRTITPPVLPVATWPPAYLLDDAALNDFTAEPFTIRDGTSVIGALPPEAIDSPPADELN